MKLEIDIKKRKQELVDEFKKTQEKFKQAQNVVNTASKKMEQIRGALAELQKIEGDGKMGDKPEKRI